MSAANNVVRPVGMLEKLYVARQVLGIYHSVVFTATYATPNDLEDSTVCAILGMTIPSLLIRHPALCCYFEGENTSKPVFKRLDTINIQDIIRVEHIEYASSLAKKLEELHDQRWSTTQPNPLWKMVALREPGDNTVLHITFVYHHAIGDGLSGVAFHRSLLNEIKTIQQASNIMPQISAEIFVPNSVDLIPPVEKLVDLPISWSFLIKNGMQEYLPGWLGGSSSPLW